MNKEQQIEEIISIMATSNNPFVDVPIEIMPKVAEALYNAGYRKVPYGAVILSPEERDDEMKEINKTLAERDEIKAKINKLEEQLAEYKKPIDKFIKDREAQAVKEFAEKLKIKAIKLTAIESYHICEFINELLKEYDGGK